MSAAFSQTLNSITTKKLQVLSRQHKKFNSSKEKTLSSVEDSGDSRERVQILLDGIKSWSSTDTTSTESSIGTDETSQSAYVANVERFMAQAKNDPSIGETSLREWETTLTQRLETEKVKFEYAELFGKLLTEWISNSTSNTESIQGDEEGLGEGAEVVSSSEDTFEKVGRKEMHEQRAIFESHVFNAKETDAAAIVAYLDELFSSSKESKAQLEGIRQSVRKFGKRLLHNTTLSTKDLNSTISSLLASDLLSNEKRNTLKEFTQSKTILSEVADVLNMYLSSISSWSWTDDGIDAIPIEMRRELNGKYRIFMDEEILQAIFLQYIGLRWAVEFKRSFGVIFMSSAWKPPIKPLSKNENERREYFLGENPREFNSEDLGAPATINDERRSKQQNTFFMSQLPDTLENAKSSYTADEDNNTDNDGDDESVDKASRQPAVQIKQSLLHIVATECLLNTKLRGKFTIVRSDFSWFGPSLSHTSLLTALTFFGVSKTWIGFFQGFLSSPLRFVADGPSAPIQVRKCGVPISHSLSDVLGEVLLFCMDYAINQRADGLFLYRIHDDFWFWDSDSTACVKAWKEMNTFAQLVGLEFNYEKTGSVSVGQPLHPDLPEGSIRWGFLKFEESGKFVIDQSQVDIHIAELKLQLAACSSIFGWIQAYNKYVSSFFVNNFGSPPAQCFGQKHIDMVISTLQRIQLELFPKHHGSVTEYLAEVIHERFGVSDIPAGWFYWPISIGGLEVKNPFINQYAMRDSICVDPLKFLVDETEFDKIVYDQLKEGWDNGTTKKPYTQNKELHKEPFPSFEEYVQHRERRFARWGNVYGRLLSGADECMLPLTAALEAKLNEMSHNTGTGSISRGGWNSMNIYWKWIVACFGEGMVKKWGGLEVVKPGVLPVGMVDAWKSRKLRWEQ